MQKGIVVFVFANYLDKKIAIRQCKHGCKKKKAKKKRERGNDDRMQIRSNLTYLPADFQ
jgi:hypothetical protein